MSPQLNKIKKKKSLREAQRFANGENLSTRLNKTIAFGEIISIIIN